jgi:hypothetical protein
MEEVLSSTQFLQATLLELVILDKTLTYKVVSMVFLSQVIKVIHNGDLLFTKAVLERNYCHYLWKKK